MIAVPGTHANALLIGIGATLGIHPGQGVTQTISTAFTGAGNLDIAGGGIVALNQAVPNFTGRVAISNGTLRLTSGGGSNGIFSNATFDSNIPITVRAGGVVELATQNAVGWLASHSASYFAELNEGAAIRKTADVEESMTRGLRFAGSASLVNASATVWRLRSGITLKALAGTTAFSQTSTAGFALFNDVAVGDRVIFDVDTGAAVVVSAALSRAGGSPTGLRKTGGGTLTLSGASSHGTPVEIQAGTFVFTGSSTGDSAYTISPGAALRGAGSIGGTGGVTVKSGATVEMGLSVEKLVLEGGCTITVLPEANPLAARTSFSATGEIEVDVSAVSANAFGTICSVLTWPEGAAPAASFSVKGANAEIFALRQTETELVLYRKPGSVISLY